MTATTVVLDSPEAIQRHLRDGIGREDFAVPGVRFVVCDDRNEVRAHFHVSETPPAASFDDCTCVVGVFAGAVADFGGDNAMLVALTRRGEPTLTPPDRRWFHAVRQVCAERQVRMLGVHVVTPKGQREVQLDDAL
jgi:hypothetical protein